MSSLRKTYSRIANPPSPIITFGLSEDGTASGNTSILGDYSITPKDFYITCEPGAFYGIAQINVSVSDTGNVTTGAYGAINGGLINPLSFFYESVDAERTYFPPLIKTNGDLINAATDSSMLIYSGNERITMYNLRSLLGGVTTLVPGTKFGLTVNDDMSDLTYHKSSVQFVRRILDKEE